MFSGQGLLSLSLDTDYNIAAAEVTRILYKKPDETTGYWSASVSGDTLTYNIQNADLDVEGLWEVQAYVEISGEKGFGEKAYILVKEPIS